MVRRTALFDGCSQRITIEWQDLQSGEGGPHVIPLGDRTVKSSCFQGGQIEGESQRRTPG